MINKPRFRKGKKAARLDGRSPKQQKLSRRFARSIVRYRIKRHAQAQAAIRAAFAAVSTVLSTSHIARIQSTMGITPQQKTIEIAKVVLGMHEQIAKAFQFNLPEPNLTA